MYFTKMTLAASTALTLSMTSAYADSNKAYLDQNGNDNSASIDQSLGSNNKAGASSQKVTQNGNWNTISIDQSGSNNSIGLGANTDSGLGVTQTRASTTSTKNSNKMTLTQTSDNNQIGSAVQSSSAQGFNTLTISQGGTGDNAVGSVYQRQSSSVTNIATITQNGHNNTLDRVSQDARVGGGYNPNEITVTMDGSNNGGDVFTGGGAAEASGAMSSNLIQGIDLGVKGNKIDITVAGTSNEFGVSQYGTLNKATGITFGAGSADNELGIFQSGLANEVALGSIDGADNRLGVRQAGSYNTVSLVVNGNENGGFHSFGSNVAGSLASNMGLTAGLTEQVGSLNDAFLTVSGDGNVFAMLQDNASGGLGNTIVGNQDNSTGGAGNQAAVAQVGGNNSANFNQIGSGNITAISQ